MLSVLSCTEEVEVKKDKVVHLKFETVSDSNNARSTSEYEEFSAKVLSLSPLEIESEELEVIEVVHSETLKVIRVVVKKNSEGANSSMRVSCTPGIRMGHFYDGNDCWVYGTIATGDDCETLFAPADYATQYVMNVCGWSNVA
ncbi:hypothetical protein V6R21_04860 [Limibacter armeniacum]|uniref:hypothetical protein n=1 Tax=Limibacter armeniacum TaxID=466084 RepID=UPI002FE4FD71